LAAGEVNLNVLANLCRNDPFLAFPGRTYKIKSFLIAEVAKKWPQSLPGKSKQFNATGFDRVLDKSQPFSSPIT
jgi:hypothetical protein